MRLLTRTPFCLPFKWPRSFPCFILSNVFSDHFGFACVRSIQPSTVVQFSPANVLGSFFSNSLTIFLVLHSGPPTKIRTLLICLKRKGVNQLWYLTPSRRITFNLWPWGFLVFSFIFFTTARAGRLNSATDPPWSRQDGEVLVLRIDLFYHT